MTWRALAAAAGLLAAAACAHPAMRPTAPESREAPSPPGEAGPSGPELGLASFYARSLQGQRTASGARYNSRAMTCAHRTYAFGTVLRVTDVESGRSVLVKVTDRGPFVPGRVVDLSWAAARRLGILDRGVARVRVEPAG
jgi:rare lipoprotein A